MHLGNELLVWRIASARRLLARRRSDRLDGSSSFSCCTTKVLGGSRKAAVQLWKWERRQRIYANAQQAAGRPATEAKGSRGAAERQAGGESKPETAAQAARRHRSEHRLREKHLARKIWAAVRVRKHLSRWCERARAAVAKRPAPSSTLRDAV